MDMILIAGLPATGKSRFADYAASALNLPLFCKDSIKEILFDDVGFSSHSGKTQLNYASFHIMIYAAEQVLQTGKSVILENNFENYAKPDLLRLVKTYGCNIITVMFTGDVKTIYRRYIERNSDPSRHRGHILSDSYPETTPNHAVQNPISYEQFRDDFQKRGMSDFNVGGKRIEVDTTDFSSIDYDTIVREIQALQA